MNVTRKRVLVVENEQQSTRFPVHLLSPEIFSVECVSSAEEAHRAITECSHDILLLDARFDSELCLSLLDSLRYCVRQIPVLVVSPEGAVKTAVAAMKRGASEVIDTPLSAPILAEALSQCKTQETPASRPHRSSRSSVQGDFGQMVGASFEMKEVFSKLSQVAQRDTTVLITGESGTGKELVAREIHARSSRSTGPFVAINCAAIPETLIESELFGHERGAFTHALERRLGQVELANEGTLFLDEIGELSLAVQVKLLRFLQEQEFYRVGRSKPISVDLRVITATNRDLEEAVIEKTFRKDLLYRINVINLHIPPLRQRGEDIPRLISHCVSKLSPRYSSKTLTFDAEALNLLQYYSWPGNVRELENVLESLLALSPSPEIRAVDLPEKIRRGSPASEMHEVQGMHASGLAFGEAERIFETEMIVSALHKADFVQTRAAQLLGITRRILKYKMDKLGISDRGQVRGHHAAKRHQSH